MKLERVNLHEVRELEPLVLATLSEVETGLVALDNQLSAGDSGRPDVLASDSEGALVILELKSVQATDAALSQVLRYYEWFNRNSGMVSRVFPNVNPQCNIRLFIVAPDFSDDLLRLSKYIDLEISLIRCTPLRDSVSQELGIVYELIDNERRDDGPSAFRSLEDIVNNISDLGVKSEFQKVLEELKSKGVDLVPYKGGKYLWIECRYNGEDIGYLQTRKKFFRSQHYNSESEEYIWPPVKCFSFSEWKKYSQQFFISVIRG